MATYEELHNLIVQESLVKAKVRVALVIAAKTVIDELTTTPNHTERLAWARNTLENLDAELLRAFPIILATYSTLTVAQIQAATDAQIQTAVDNHVNFLAGV